ncbi:HEAVY METAL ASSOCIATED PROTEIN 21, SODIUM POTASSIUM ROOT DEFECTIVE 2 [Hibiscus trionum]|uniref:HEAVY METAL ASSOCIATED PROTEIN 21, SODIUM POTASSIUM ROOT DEFECTIVE 2 n=1 Tax=Hibiscus trionum TaxID=183268 RepID=A0A9W7JBS4_HIBTR|nr:HEAVY METAL ASSOCIATED PROTEIN 21, SODIUM POTASSIUM ROOT DEFECTIVE 2 [Hibiscus trionum]
MDESASSSSSSASAIQLGGRAIDRHNPIIRDAKRFNTNPLPSNQISLRKNGKGSKNDHKNISSSVTAKPNDQKKTTGNEDNGKAKGIDLFTPPGSSRYLLGDSVFLSDYDPVWALVPAEENKIQAIKQDHSISSKPSFNEKPPKDQVVVLRVSLHCKGCEGKLRKHLSRMEGVTSFNIDFKAKKVTIVGDVTPSSVLASVSKVKNAQFWTYATATPAPASTNFLTKK